MPKLINLVNAPEDKRILMEMFKGSRKVAEYDISDLTARQRRKEIWIQEKLLGRTYTYKTIKL